jgi:hypothetical protein
MSARGTDKEAKDAANMKIGDYADAKPYDRGPLNKLQYGIQKPHSPSVFNRVSDIAMGLGTYIASNNPYSFENLRDAAYDEYQMWRIENEKNATDVEKKAKFNEYNEHVKKLRRFFKFKKGGKNKSRKSGKSRKNRKTRSRKNRKTRSRKNRKTRSRK